MNIQKSKEIKNLCTILQLTSKKELTEEDIVIINKTMGNSINRTIQKLRDLSEDKDKITVLTDKVIDEIPEVDWYVLLFHFVSIELEKTKGALSYFLLTVFNRFVAENPKMKEQVLSQELTTIDIVDVLFSSDLDIAAATMALQDLLTEK